MKKKIKLPGFRILDRYIIRKFLGTYFFATALLVVVTVVFDSVEKIDDFVELKAPLQAIAFRYYLNFIPFFINQYSGLLTFIAVIFFTSKMAYNTEIVAILSNGVSFNRLMWPYFLGSFSIAMISLILNLWVIPGANGRRIDFERQYLKKNTMLKYDQHIYRQIDPGTFVYIRNFSGTNNSAGYFVLETYQDGALVSSLEAQGAAFDPETSRWTAQRSIRRTFEEGVEQYDDTQPLDTLIDLSANELGKVQDLVKTMRIGQLNQFIGQQREKGSDMIATFEVERQNRFTFPFSTFVLTVIGVSLSSRKVRGGIGLHIGLGIALCFSFILFSRFADEFAKSGSLPTLLSVWLPGVLYAFIAVYLYRKAPK